MIQSDDKHPEGDYLDVDGKGVKVHLADEGDLTGHPVQDRPRLVDPNTLS